MKFSFILLAVFAINIAHAEVYKYINEQGKISYSDVPVKNAELIVIPLMMTYQAPVIPKRQAVDEKSKSTEADIERLPYVSIEINQPKPEGTVRNNQGIVGVSYTLRPGLQKGDSVELYVDGAKQQSLTTEGLSRGQLRYIYKSLIGVAR
ncbi:MAG: DUF4124 domain-containing protein [Cycloclasticus sp.]